MVFNLVDCSKVYKEKVPIGTTEVEGQLNALTNEEEPPELLTKRISGLELQERVKERIPKATADNTKWSFTAWEDWKNPPEIWSRQMMRMNSFKFPKIC